MGRRPSPHYDIERGPYMPQPYMPQPYMAQPMPLPTPPPHYYPPVPVSRPWCAWLVPLIFVFDIAFFVLIMHVNDCPSHTKRNACLYSDSLGRFSFQPIRENPLLGPSLSTLKELGGLERTLVVEKHETWRLFSCIWLHAGVIHLGANMLSLLFTGIKLEQEFGFLRIGILYVLSGFGGSLMSSLTSAQSKTITISVGASGALFGMLGAMLSELITNWTIYANKCAALMTLVLIIGLNLAVGLLPHVDNSAHIGGFLSGFLLGFILLMRPQYGYVSSKYMPPGYNVKHKKSKHKCCQYLLWLLALVVLVLAYALGLSKLFNNQNMLTDAFQKFDHQYMLTDALQKLI